ncbi:bifunctional DNA primase/polymerase [Streptomyces sp. NPDC055078]
MNENSTTPTTPLDGALWLVQREFAVFPADHPGTAQCTGIGRGHDPKTCVDRGKHPAVAFTREHTRDEQQAHGWFKDQLRNVAIAVGACQGPEGARLLVVDSDRPGAIEEAEEALGHKHTPTMRVFTAKGYHDYYWAPAEMRLGNGLGALKGKFDGDVRSGNAYVIGPGSVHASRVVYTLEDPDQPPEAAPEWLLVALQTRPSAPVAPATNIVIPADRHDTYTRKAVQAECDAITGAPDGDQNNTINTAAFSLGTLVGAGALSEAEARETLLSAARAGNHPEGRALATIESGLRAGIAQPRHPWPPVARTDDRNDFSALLAPDDRAEAPAPAVETAPTAAHSGHLPPEFYAARPIFQHIRQAAHARGCSADVLFYATLARTSGMLSHQIRAVTGIGSPASLNTFVAMVGGSGSGKSSSSSLNRELMPAIDQDFRDGLPIGTGEGIAEMFMGVVEEPTGEIHVKGPLKGDPVMRKVRRQVRHNGFIYVDEGETLATLAMRTGSILSETLRRAAVGETLGQTNASEERTRFVAAGSYSLGLLVGFQPSTALPLLADASTGTPQRFVWGWANDPSIPDVPALWPGPIEKHPGILRPADPVDIAFPERIRRMLWTERVGRARGEIEIAELDGHAGLMKVKLSALFALLDGNRFVVTEEDWALAEMVWDASCAVRDGLVARARREAEAERQRQDDAKVHQELRVHEAKSDADLKLDRIARLVRKHASTVGGITYGALNKALASRDRPLVEKAIAYAEKENWIFVEDERICVKTD